MAGGPSEAVFLKALNGWSGDGIRHSEIGRPVAGVYRISGYASFPPGMIRVKGVDIVYHCGVEGQHKCPVKGSA